MGHADLPPDTLELVGAEVRARLERRAGNATVAVRAGAGLPVVVGRAVRTSGRRLAVLLAAEGAAPAPLPQRDRAAAGELLALADRAALLEFDPDDRAACIGADEEMIRTSRRLLAVWDGSPSDGRDATAHLVAYARARGVPVEVMWPEGASRARSRTSAGTRTRASSRHLSAAGPAPLGTPARQEGDDVRRPA
ncbi:hypothetical protein ACFV7Q_31300 [Streptomyces sp. NPDC059851]|uniref:hypothetical protein n=1 Tax=Streptomyces sp. NPDC059851 TaxID=3346971 RepID=UPI0036656C3A